MRTFHGLTAVAVTAFLVAACGGVTASSDAPPPGSDGVESDQDLTSAPPGQPSIRTIAGKNGNVPGFADGVGPQAQFDFPEAMALVGTQLFIADGRNHLIRVLDINTKKVTTVAGKPGFAGHHDTVEGGQRGEAHLNLPRSMVLDPSGKTIYFTDTGNFAIRTIDVATHDITTIAGGKAGRADGVGTAAQFGDATATPFWAGGLAIDEATNTLYIADSANQTLRAMDLATKAVTTVAGVAGQRGHADGVGQAAIFNKPNQLLLDGKGNLYIGESDTPDIRKMDLATRNVITVAGAAQADPARVCDDSNPRPPQPPECDFKDGPGLQARFRFPYGLALDSANHRMFVVDAHNNTLRTLDLETNVVKTVAGVQRTVTNDQPRGSTDSTATTVGTFSHPANVVFVPPSTLYLSDRSASAIRKITLP
jgi:DNA-binding beta-propeller fold protein YncE